MEDLNLKENISFTEKTAKKSIIWWVWLLFISLIIWIIWIYILKIELTWDNLTYIISGLFLSWLSLILFPMYFQNNIKKEEIKKDIEIEKENIKNDINFSNNEERLLYLVKDNDWTKTRKELKELFEKEYWKNLDNTVIYNLLNKGENNNFIWSIRKKYWLWTLLEETKDKKIKLTEEWLKFIWE